MPKTHKPRSGSLQFWPRKKAKRQYPRVKAWARLADASLVGFAGYKAGMTQIRALDNRSHSITKNEVIVFPVTIVECPPLKPLSLRFYKKTPYGLKVISDILSEKLDKELKRKIRLSKKKEIKDVPKEFDQISLVVYTQPKLIGLKKKPEIFEIVLSTKDIEFAKEILKKEIRVSEVFKEGQFLDVHSVTKGKGVQGPVKRMGIGLKSHKSEKGRRRPGSLGAWTPKKVPFYVAMAGQTGYQTRTEYGKQLLKLGDKPEDVNPKSGLPHYGFIKNDYVLIKGSISGPVKRLIRFNATIREKKPEQFEIKSIKK